MRPQEALVEGLHWAVINGPDAGLCLPVTPGSLGRTGGLSDTTVSRKHTKIATQKPGKTPKSPAGKSIYAALEDGINPTKTGKWIPIRLGHRFRRVKIGGKLIMGKTTLELRKRPKNLKVPQPSNRGKTPTRYLLTYIFTFLGLITLTLFRPWLAVPIALAIIFAITFYLHRNKKLRLDPSRLILSSCARQKGTPEKTDSPSLKAWIGRPGIRRDKNVLEVTPGTAVALIGDNSLTAASWWVGQLLVRGELSVTPESIPALGAPSALLSTQNESNVYAAVYAGYPEKGTQTIKENTCTVVCIPAGKNPPAWCTQFIDTSSIKVPPLSQVWFQTLANSLQSCSATKESQQATLPDMVDPEILDISDPNKIVRNWSTIQRGLTARIGVEASGSLHSIDLKELGPHALIAGTTGSGKSELLTTWILDLAAHYSPKDLTFILVDYKGGTAFKPLEELPHCSGVLSDLNPSLTSRALLSLRAELRRREALLVDYGARNIFDLPEKTLQRILVVVDEFRALSEDHPEVMETLIRLATQGRSLGMHLLMATQKPSGVISGQILANTNLRIGLRMQSDSDSIDVLESSIASEIPSIPGRIVVKEDELTTLQVPWAGKDDWLNKTITAIQVAWKISAGDEPGYRPWKNPLPANIKESDSISNLGKLNFALCDIPHQANQAWWNWNENTPLLILGPSHSGKTNALKILAKQQLNSRNVYIITSSVEEFKNIAAPNLWCIDSDAISGWYNLLENALNGSLHESAILLDDIHLIHQNLSESIGEDKSSRFLKQVFDAATRGTYCLSATGEFSIGRNQIYRAATQRIVLEAKNQTDLLLSGVENYTTNPQFRNIEAVSIFTPGRGLLIENNDIYELQICEADDSRGKTDFRTSQSGNLPPLLKVSALPEKSPRHCRLEAASGIYLGVSSPLLHKVFKPASTNWIVWGNNPAQKGSLLDHLEAEYIRLGYSREDLNNTSADDQKKRLYIITPELLNDLSIEETLGKLVTLNTSYNTIIAAFDWQQILPSRSPLVQHLRVTACSLISLNRELLADPDLRNFPEIYPANIADMRRNRRPDAILLDGGEAIPLRSPVC